jgi:endonuclease G
VDADTPLSGTDTANEWFELQNVSASNITLSGWTISDNVTSNEAIPTVTLGPGGHVIVAATSAGFASEHPGFTGTVLTIADGSIGNGLANGNDRLILKDSNGATVDAVSWGTDVTAFSPAVPVDSSTTTNQRNAAGTDTDTAADWSRPAQTPDGDTKLVATPGALQFNSATYSVNENGGSANITVTRTGGSNGSVSITYATSNSSATSGSDYTSVSGTLSFAGGDTGSKTFSVPILDDTTFEGNETVTLTLSAPTGGATLGSPSTATLTIVENDPQPNQPIATNCPNPPSTVQGTATSVGVSATDPDGTVTSASITSAFVAGITLDNFVPAAAGGGTATATLNVANTTAAGTYNVNILYSNNDSPTPQTASCTVTVNVQSPPVPPGTVVISQIYGGGGNSGAVLQNDFIEIFNRSSNTVNLSGWSVQYSSAAGSSWSNRTNLSGSLAPGQYYLISGASNGSNGASLPAADIIGGIDMSASNGKVALVSSTTALTGTCPVGGTTVVDFIGYGGTATCYEGPGPAPTLSASTAALRARNGCKDTDYNEINFTEGTPTPRNSSSPLNVCPAGDEAPEVFSTTPINGEFNVNLNSDITIRFDQLVNVTGDWFQISCGTSGIHTATVTGGPANFTLNPDTDFGGSEQCTVTVFANAVTDQDSQDPPDNMAADYVFNFRTFVPRDPAEHMVMGNPSGATTDTSVPDNYLMMKNQYALSYNNSRAIPNWTSWHLDTSWVTGVSDRQNDFRSDNTLPPGFTRVASGYNFGTYGFDRGHMTPSADRTSSIADNSATFLMTNMVPQASGNNQGPWADLEDHIRTLLNNGANEIYIVSGGQGVGGTSTTGSWNSIVDTGGNSVTVPKYTWKVIMVLPVGDDDVARVNASTRTFAVIMPNNDNIRPDDWKKYLATVDQVEALTGQNYFSNVPEDIQSIIEARLDSEYNTGPAANGQTVTTAEDTAKQVTLTVSDFNVNNELSYTVLGGPQHGSISDIVDGKLTYTPNEDYNGPDSFTFKVNDGGKDSNTATVSINVTTVNDAPVANADSKTTDEDSTLTFLASDLAGNDSTGPANEADQTLTVTKVIPTDTHGTVSLAAGQVTYTPAANYNGAAGFDYEVCDNGTTNGAATPKCATGTVNITVNAVNDGPTADSQSVVTGEDTPKVITLSGSDTETAAGDLTYAITVQPAHGVLTGTAPNLTYVPAADYNGPDSFQFTVTDKGDGASPALTSAPATVSITVEAGNDAPEADAGADQTVECSGAVTLTGTGFDRDGDTLAYEWREGAAVLGTGVTLNKTLTFGSHTITLKVTDPSGASDEDTVVVNVIDLTAPTLTSNGQVIAIWPPNKKYQQFGVSDLIAGASDSCDASVNLSSVVIAQVTSDEGSASNNDVIIGADCKSVQLRADRNGGGDGRVYTITFRVRDTAGNTTTLKRQVTVPHNQGSSAIDSGVAYTVASSCL